MRCSLVECSVPVQADEAPKKPYSAPQWHRLSFEQASLLLVGRAWNGDPGARYLLKLMFPLPGERPLA